MASVMQYKMLLGLVAAFGLWCGTAWTAITMLSPLFNAAVSTAGDRPDLRISVGAPIFLTTILFVASTTMCVLAWCAYKEDV